MLRGITLSMEGELAALSLSLERARSTPASARSALRHALIGGPLDQYVDDVLLAASELITNAVTYTEGGCEVTARWSTEQPWVRIEVADFDHTIPDLPAPPTASSIGGHGLLIVTSLAKRWGIQHTETGKNIWFEMGHLAFPRLFERSATSAAMVATMSVRRALPLRRRRMVGAWCLADHMGPIAVTAEHGIDIAPHPHCGVHTLTWLTSGEMVHRDSLGTEQMIRAGELNLMTAGSGISHSEEASRTFSGDLHGVQMWLAQPEATRNDVGAFEHHPTPPKVELPNGAATVLVGDFADVVAPARRDSDVMGVELLLRPGTAVAPLRLDYEHAIVMLDGDVVVDGAPFAAGFLGYLGMGRDELALSTTAGARLMLLGGAPFGEQIHMSWNFVGRTQAEIEAAHESWSHDDGRFGRVESTLARTPGPIPHR